MLKRVAKPVFTHKIKVTRPVEGGFTEESFTGRFRALKISESDAFNLMTREGTDDYLRAIFVGWGEDYVSEGGDPVPYSDVERDELIDDPCVRQAILTTYNAAMLGAKRGN
jgi:hypothetical protein